MKHNTVRVEEFSNDSQNMVSLECWKLVDDPLKLAISAKRRM